jgi:hypothetical protein
MEQQQQSFLGGCLTRIIFRLLFALAIGFIGWVFSLFDGDSQPSPAVTLRPTATRVLATQQPTYFLQTDAYIKQAGDDWSDAIHIGTFYVEMTGADADIVADAFLSEWNDWDDEEGFGSEVKRIYKRQFAPFQCKAEYLGVTIRVFSHDEEPSEIFCDAMLKVFEEQP